MTLPSASFRITQPGSSVATSLTSGESVRKHVGVLDIKCNQFRMRPVPLTQVRSFIMGDLSLQQHEHLDPADPKIDPKLTSHLEEEVRLLILNAKEKHEELLEAAKAADNYAMEEPKIKFKLQRPDEVLIRLKVEHSGFSTLNNQRFGARFVGKVANPDDILLFHRRKEARASRATKKKGPLSAPLAPEERDEVNIDELVKDTLVSKDIKLGIYSEKSIGLALDEFVNKDQSKALNDAFQSILKKQQKKLIQRGVPSDKNANPDDEEEMLTTAAAVRELVEQESQGTQEKENMESKTAAKRKRRAAASTEDEDDEENEPPKRRARASSGKAKSAASKSTRNAGRRSDSKRTLDEDSEDEDDSQERSSQTSRRGARPRRQTSRSRVSYRDDLDSDEASEESDAVIELDDDDDDDDNEIEEERPKKRSRATASSRNATTKKGRSVAKTSSRPTSKRAKRLYGSDSDDVGGGKYGSRYEADDDWENALTNSQRR